MDGESFREEGRSPINKIGILEKTLYFNVNYCILENAMRYIFTLLLLFLFACGGGKSTGGDEVTPDSTGNTPSSSSIGDNGGGNGDGDNGGGNGGSDPNPNPDDDYIPPPSSSSAAQVSTGPFSLVFVDSTDGSQYVSGVLTASSAITAVETKVEKDGVDFPGVRISFGTPFSRWIHRNPGNPYTNIPLTGEGSLETTVNLYDSEHTCDGHYAFIFTVTTATAETISDTPFYELTRWAKCP